MKWQLKTTQLHYKLQLLRFSFQKLDNQTEEPILRPEAYQLELIIIKRNRTDKPNRGFQERKEKKKESVVIREIQYCVK